MRNAPTRRRRSALLNIGPSLRVQRSEFYFRLFKAGGEGNAKWPARKLRAGGITVCARQAVSRSSPGAAPTESRRTRERPGFDGNCDLRMCKESAQSPPG